MDGAVSWPECQEREQHQPRPANHLARLPVEIVSHICAQLCSHCCGSEVEDLLRVDDQVCRRALLALCLTSRRLRDVAQAFLFHHLWHQSPFDANLIRTLLRRPDLAASVHILDQNTCVPLQHPNKEDLGFIYDTARLLGLGTLDRPELEGTKGASDLLAEILIALLPCLQSLVLVQKDDDGGNSPGFRHLGNRPGLPNLRSLKIEAHGHLVGREGPLLRSLIAACPRLTLFSYTAYGHMPTRGHQWSSLNPTAGILSCLEPSKGTLRHLEIDLSRQNKLLVSPDGMPSLEADSLEGFSELEVVKLSSVAFCQCRRHITLRLSDRCKAQCLTRLLGPVSQTLRTLVVKVGRISRAWIDIVHLGSEVAQGKYPRLEVLRIYPTLTQRFGMLWGMTRHVKRQNQFVLSTFRATTVSVILMPPEIVELDDC